MNLNLVSTIGATAHIEHRTGGAGGPVVAYHVLGGTTQTHSWEIPISAQPGDSLRMLWGTFPTWSYMGPAYTVREGEASVYWTRTSAVGPSGSMTVAVQGELATQAIVALPSYFNATSAELLYAFKTGLYPVLGLGFTLAFGRYLVEVVRRRGSPPPEA